MAIQINYGRSSLPRTHIASLILLALAGAAVVAYATHQGPWAGSDSVEYFEAASNFADGRGLVLIRASGAVRPLSLRPPLYPILLAAIHRLGAPLLSAARVISIASIAAFLFVSGLLVYVGSRSLLMAMLIVVVLGTSPALLDVFAGAMSEGVFYALGIASLVAVFGLLEGRRGCLPAAAVLAGLAILARFAGMAWGVAVLTGIFVFSSRHLPARLYDGAKFALLSLGPIVVWMLYVSSLGESATNIELQITGIWSRLAPVRIAIVDAVWSWLPLAEMVNPAYRTKLFILLGGAAALVAMSLVSLRARMATATYDWKADRSVTLAGLLGTFAAVYALFITTTFLFVKDPKPALNERILGPLQFGLLVCGVAIPTQFARSFSPAAFITAAVPLVFAVPLVLSQLPESIDLVADLHENGGGYASRSWQDSELIRAVSAFPDDVPLISNDIEAIMFHLGRPAYRVPELERGEQRRSFGAFGERSTDPVETIFREQGAALVLFDSAYWQFNAIYGARTDERWHALTEGLRLHADVVDGRIFFYDRD